jgi:chromatin segregation and condensation protein Rec8/ScpA/Scc1 (kleisin family)
MGAMMNQTYQDIREALQQFQTHSIRLADLIERVPELVKTLGEGDEQWKAEFVGFWWTLEQVHEEAIEVGESRRLPPERRNAVDEAVNGMMQLINQKLPIDLHS